MKILIPLLFTLLAASLISAQGFSEISATNNLPTGYQSGEYGGGLSFVDFNQDGLDDLTFASGQGETIHFLVNTGNSFEEIPSLVGDFSEVKQVIWLDYNNDGELDLFITSHDQNRLYKNLGDLNLQDVTASTGFGDAGYQSFCGVWLDYDEDGYLDLCISHRTAFLQGHIKLYRNLGNDQFQNVTIQAGLANLGNSVLAISSFDMNNDGLEDIYVGQDYDAGNLLLKNLGDGTFQDISFASNTDIQNNTMSVTIGDYNNDGWMDIYVTNTYEGNAFLENQGDETFIEKALELGLEINFFTWGASFLDADNDMDLDLFISAPSGSFIFQYLVDGLPFVNSSSTWGFDTDSNYSVGNAIGDMNGDRRVDIGENNKYASLHYLWQNDFQENNSIAILLEGNPSNKMAVGAVIDVYAGGIHQIRRVGCGEGFSSQNSYTQFFGLGTNTIIDEITITWPNGGIDTYQDVPGNIKILIPEDYIPAPGCLDPASCNYNPFASEDDGSCIYPELYYDCFGNCLNDLDLDGICDELEIPGCTDINACNFNPMATDDDGNCNYPDLYYDCDGNCLNDMDLDGICDELEIFGCIDPNACNYNPLATEDNGICTYPDLYYDCDGNCLNDIDLDGICDELEVGGCTDQNACNYDPNATDDNGTCSFIQAFMIEGNDNPPLDNTIYTYPFTPGSTYLWALSGGQILNGQGTNQLEVLWEQTGTGSISVTETNEAECLAYTSLTVNVLLTITQEIASYNIDIYPTPASDFLIIEPGDWINQLVRIELFDTNGRSIIRKEESFTLSTLNLQDIPSGIYFLAFANGTKTIQQKVLIQH